MGNQQLEPGCMYHIYNHAVGREQLFLSDDNYFYFLRRYQHFIPPVAETFAYCLMSNHIHFLIEVKNPVQIPAGSKYSESQFVSKQFSNLFSSYSQAFNKQQNRMGNLFISNFKRSKIETDEYLTTVTRYIHLNPVNHGVVKDASKWKFSSFNIVLSDQETFLAKEKLLRLFGGAAEFKRHHQVNVPKV